MYQIKVAIKSHIIEQRCPVPLFKVYVISERQCKEDQIKCEDGYQCIYDHSLCDGYTHCDDESDEDPDMCKGKISTV